MVKLYIFVMTQNLGTGSFEAEVDTVLKDAPVTFMWGAEWERCTGLENYSERTKEWTKCEFPLLASLKKILLTYYRLL